MDAPFWTTITSISWLSLKTSGTALLLSALMGVPLGAYIGYRPFKGRWAVMVILNTLTGLPPVLVGLFVYLALSRTGPLGQLEMLFTVPAIIVAQIFLAMPLVATIVAGTVMGIDPELPEQLTALGASRWQVLRASLRECRSGLLIALATGFGAVISEVGAVMMVGGNIEGQTRVLTTAILLETRKGDFALALALGGVLLTLTLIVNIGIMAAQRPRGRS